MGWLRRLEHGLDGRSYTAKAARLRRRALHALMHFDLKGEAFVE